MSERGLHARISKNRSDPVVHLSPPASRLNSQAQKTYARKMNVRERQTGRSNTRSDEKATAQSPPGCGAGSSQIKSRKGQASHAGL